MTETNLKPYIIGQKIILHDATTHKFLVLKANKPKGKKFEQFWKTYFPYDLPGGRIENGETIAEGLARDVQANPGRHGRLAATGGFRDPHDGRVGS